MKLPHKLLQRMIYKKLPWVQQYNLRLGQWLYARKVASRRTSTTKRYQSENDLLVNVGCGATGHEGWVNVDYGNYEGVTCIYDCSLGLPFADSSVKAIFSEHFFEHLDYDKEVPVFLSHCFRVLQPGGVIRIIVPDAEKIIRAYCDDGWEQISKVRPLTSGRVDAHLGNIYNTKMEVINMVFRQQGEHKFAYDYETLKFCLEKTGFRGVMKMEFGRSRMCELAIDLKVRESESLYVEAIR